MTKAEWLLDINEDESNPMLRVEVEMDLLRRPLLGRAGIVDLNHVLEVLPDSVLEPYLHSSDTGLPFHVAHVIFEMRSAYYSASGKEEISVIRPSYQGEHYVYTLVSDGFIADIMQTAFFRRQLDVPQLSLRPSLPLPNYHTRGEHSIYTTINIVRTLQVLSDADPATLEARLRRDFELHEFYDADMSREEVFNLAVDMAVSAGMLHDSALPAGGDAIKHLLGLHEEEDLDWLFFEEHDVLADRRAELLATLNEQRLDSAHLRFIVDCIRGRSSSLIGDMINPAVGDFLDWDRIGYTLLDMQEGTLMGHEVPKRLLPPRLTALHEATLLKMIIDAISVFEDTRIVGVYGFDAVLSTSIIDPTEDFILDNNGELVNTEPEKLAWVAALRIMMTGYCYNGGKMLGYEAKLHERLRALMSQGVGLDLLTRETLIGMTNTQLFEELRQIGDPELNGILEDISFQPSKQRFDSQIVPDNMDASDAFAAFPIRINPGLDTRVLHDGIVMTLEDYYRANPTGVAPMLIKTGIEKFKDTQVVIYEIEDSK